MRSGVFLLALSLITFSLAQPTLEEAESAWETEFEASLERKTGKLELLNGAISLEIPADFYYLDSEDAKRVITEAWDNPDGDSLGMLFPLDTSPLDYEGWGIILSYKDIGYVKDADAANINYDYLLAELQRGSEYSNERREVLGYDIVELVGWVNSPFYDEASNILFWAQELAFGDSPEHTLNYNVDILGRSGVLNLNAVANMKQFGAIENKIGDITEAIEFTAGNHYDDYDSTTDKSAGYGLARLITHRESSQDSATYALYQASPALILVVVGILMLITPIVANRLIPEHA